MPNPWKRFGTGGSGSGVSRLLAGLRPPEQGGSLVVQTGFPTSLADLVVKNRGRLKKPSRRKKPQPSQFDSSVLGSVVSSSAASSAPPFNVRRRPGPIDPPAPEADSSSLSSLGTSVTVIREIEFLLVVIVILLALATERRKLVVAIMLSAIVLRLFEWNGLRLIRFSSPRSGAKRNLDSPVKDWELEGRGVVSPIREVTTDSSSERSSVDLIQGREVSLESRGLKKVHLEPAPVPKSNSKVKKFLRKLLPKKFRRRKGHKERGDFIPESSKKAILDEITELDEASNGDADVSIEAEENTVSLVASDKVSGHQKEYIKLAKEDKHETKSRNSQVLVFWAVVLLGLLGVAFSKGIDWGFHGAGPFARNWPLIREKFLEKNDEGHGIATCRNPNEGTGLLDLKDKFEEGLKDISPGPSQGKHHRGSNNTAVKESYGRVMNLLINASGILSMPDVLQPESAV